MRLGSCPRRDGRHLRSAGAAETYCFQVIQNICPSWLGCYAEDYRDLGGTSDCLRGDRWLLR
jgi:hypothetical protein